VSDGFGDRSHRRAQLVGHLDGVGFGAHGRRQDPAELELDGVREAGEFGDPGQQR
jgi:hypothetical protein